MGDKWFHNLIKKKYHTQYKSKRDAFNSYKRTLLSFQADEIKTVGSLQMVRFTLVGQSFGYNQIRKMVSAVVETEALGGDLEILKRSFDPKVKKHFNNAPSQGLILWSASYAQETGIGLAPETLEAMAGFREDVSAQVALKHEL